MRILLSLLLCCVPSIASGQDLLLVIGDEPTTTGGLDSRVVVEQLTPALPRVAACYRHRAELPAPLRLSFDAAGVPRVLGQPGVPVDCLHTAVSGMRVGVSPTGSPRLASVPLVVYGREVVPPPPPDPPPPREASDEVDVGLIVGLALGGGALVGSAMMLGSADLAEADRGFLFWPGLVLAAPGLAVGGVLLLIGIALEQ